MRRSCASISANIAKGCGRLGQTELGRFLEIAQGSASELEYHLLLAKDLKYLENDIYSSLFQQVIEVKRMLTALMKKIKSG